MKRGIRALAGALVAALASTAGAADGSAARPRRDPFAMPTAFRAPPAVAAGSTKAVAESPWAPRLRGVMVAGQRSMVDIEGVMVVLGDSVDGWRLIKVGERDAVFSRKGKQITLQLAAQKEPNR